ncbi:MAG: OmpH family outer membrane protein [Wenzhouxiangella sp.]|jgi:Skp family chaperone for outer membrane proteins|nr:OmpH family outer membrane protein [Wenzhouxiangella sp.]
MRRFDRIVLCLLTAGVCTLAAQQVLRVSPAGASVFTQDGDAAAATKHQIAVCAVNRVIRELLESDRFLPARQAINVDELIAEYEELEARMNQLRQQFEQLQQGGQMDPGQQQAEAQRIQEEAQQLGTRMQQIQQEAQERDQELQQLTYEQLKEAYELTRSAAEAVAESFGYDYVAASQRAEDDFNLNAASLPAEFNARPILVYPGGVDITADVLAELNLD